MNYPNFYESIQEAQIRLRNTVVEYRGEPYYVIAITDHVKDGKFRVYLSPLVDKNGKRPTLPEIVEQIPPGIDELGKALDAAVETGVILRKEMDSPYFNKFRPFPLGMCQLGNNVYYLERQPNRVTQQGLLRSMIIETKVDCLLHDGIRRTQAVNIFSQAFIDCIKADHHTPQECLSVLLDTKNYEYSATAFHRHFAFIRGPCDIIFLGYKDEIIGLLPYSDLSTVKLSKRHLHFYEVTEELRLFNTIQR